MTAIYASPPFDPCACRHNAPRFLRYLGYLLALISEPAASLIRSHASRISDRVAIACRSVMRARPVDLAGRIGRHQARINALHSALRETVEGAGVENSTPAELPYWQAAPCPAWCDRAPHDIEWGQDDRNHVGEIFPVVLTSMDAVNFGAPGHPEFKPHEVDVQLWQHYREIEPRVWLSHGDLVAENIRLTLAEAGALAGHLTALVASARRSA